MLLFVSGAWVTVREAATATWWPHQILIVAPTQYFIDHLLLPYEFGLDMRSGTSGEVCVVIPRVVANNMPLSDGLSPEMPGAIVLPSEGVADREQREVCVGLAADL
jgi:hypothetical protein